MSSKEPNRNNKFRPLQTLPDSDNSDIECDEIIDPTPKASKKQSKIPSVCVLQKTSEDVHKLCSDLNLSDYSIKKMSIGIKINCESLESRESLREALKRKNWQFYTHDLPAMRSFKVMLYGLHELNTDVVKNELISIGLKCQNVKIIKKQYAQFIDIFYLVYLDIGSVRLNELKQNTRSIFRTQVKWDFARRPKNKITQCYNCQMYGHGEKNCNIKTHCANCSENHGTNECKSMIIKCANCNEAHKSNDPSCISRKSFVEIRERLSSRNKQRSSFMMTKRNINQQPHLFIPSNDDFPTLKPHKSSEPTAAAKNVNEGDTCPNVWSSRTTSKTDFDRQQTNTSSLLFSMDEINSLTAEMITLLSHCKSKADQFNCIAQLAIKYLYAGK